MNKKELRDYIKSCFLSYTSDQLQAFSDAMQQRLSQHPCVMQARVVVLYWSLPNEVGTHRLVRELHRQGKTVMLPRVVNSTDMTLHRFTSEESMHPGPYNILEPTGPAVTPNWLNAQNADMTSVICLVPGVAFDNNGHRLGHGRGYYDRMLRRLPHVRRIGICFPFQMVDNVPSEPHDIRMDEVVC